MARGNGVLSIFRTGIIAGVNRKGIRPALAEKKGDHPVALTILFFAMRF